MLLDSTGSAVSAPPTLLLPSTCVVVYVPCLAPLVTSSLENGRQPLAWYVVVHQRADNGWWGFPGGAQEVGESLLDCARREVMEETGLAVALSRLCALDTDPAQGALCQYPDGNVVQYTCAVFTALPAVRSALLPPLRCSEESHDVRWVSTTQLPKPFLPTHHWRLEQAMACHAATVVR